MNQINKKNFNTKLLEFYNRIDEMKVKQNYHNSETHIQDTFKKILQGNKNIFGKFDIITLEKLELGSKKILLLKIFILFQIIFVENNDFDWFIAFLSNDINITSNIFKALEAFYDLFIKILNIKTENDIKKELVEKFCGINHELDFDILELNIDKISNQQEKGKLIKDLVELKKKIKKAKKDEDGDDNKEKEEDGDDNKEEDDEEDEDTISLAPPAPAPPAPAQAP